VWNVPVIAEIAVTAHVSRTIDAGLLVTRVHQLRDFSVLRRYLDSLIVLHETKLQHPMRPTHTPTRIAGKRPSRSPQTCPFR